MSWENAISAWEKAMDSWNRIITKWEYDINWDRSDGSNINTGMNECISAARNIKAAIDDAINATRTADEFIIASMSIVDAATNAVNNVNIKNVIYYTTINNYSTCISRDTAINAAKAAIAATAVTKAAIDATKAVIDATKAVIDATKAVIDATKADSFVQYTPIERIKKEITGKFDIYYRNKSDGYYNNRKEYFSLSSVQDSDNKIPFVNDRDNDKRTTNNYFYTDDKNHIILKTDKNDYFLTVDDNDELFYDTIDRGNTNQYFTFVECKTDKNAFLIKHKHKFLSVNCWKITIKDFTNKNPKKHPLENYQQVFYKEDI